MGIRIFNTATGRKEEFQPRVPGRVGMYVCGVTVYDLCHLGHARGAYVFEVVRRYLEHRGFEVTYVRNFTDVDDKIIRRANELGLESREVAERFIGEYYRDMGSLGVGSATVEPRATDHIPEIIRLVECLLAKGLAYPVGGDVYFRVRRFAGYGKLSHRSFDEMMAGARVEVDERKEDPMDFALWKGSKPGEPAWESPWGQGRPGWHVECSAMSMKHLGETLDIHGGGKDLVFPHHENEIAQSEGCTGRPFVRYWMHNGFVTIDREKMSKSLGNFFTIRDILEKYDPEAVRLFLLSTHYRNPIDFSDKALDDATRALVGFYAFMREAEEFMSAGASAEARRPVEGDPLFGPLKELEELPARFEEAMDDDFNTARALGEVFKATDTCRGILLNRDEAELRPQIRYLLGRYLELVGPQGRFSKVLGVFSSTAGGWAHRWVGKTLAAIDEGEIDRLIAERAEARRRKDFARADAIRRELLERGVALEDGPQGTSWRPAGPTSS